MSDTSRYPLTAGRYPLSRGASRRSSVILSGSGGGRLYTMKGAMMIKPYNRPAGVEMHPYSPTGTSPGGGSLLSAQLLAS